MILETNKLIKTYKRGGSSFNAVDNVDLKIEKGDFVNIIGRSGSGKSTLLNLLSGLLTPTSGDIFLEGNNISSLQDHELSKIRNESIGYIPQGSGTLATLNILDNVMLPFFLYKREGDAVGRAVNILQKLGLKEMMYSYPKELSGGELKRVLIARALINEPKILIADEPTANLDVLNSKDVMNVFAKINSEGTTVVLVSHEIETLSYGKKCYTMDKGKLLEGNTLNI